MSYSCVYSLYTVNEYDVGGRKTLQWFFINFKSNCQVFILAFFRKDSKVRSRPVQAIQKVRSQGEAGPVPTKPSKHDPNKNKTTNDLENSQNNKEENGIPNEVM